MRSCESPWAHWRGLISVLMLVTAIGPNSRGNAAEPAKPPRQVRPELERTLRKLGYYPVLMERGPDNALRMTGEVNGEKRMLRIFTGSSRTTVHKSRARKLKTLDELGVTLEDRYFGKITNKEVVLIERLALGEAVFQNQPAYVSDLRASGAPLDDEVALGCDFLLRNHCLVDCLDLRLYVRGEKLSEPGRASLAEGFEKGGYHRIRLEPLEDLVVSCEARLNSHPVNLELNTGAMFTSVDLAQAARLGLRPMRTDARLVGTSGSAPFFLAEVQSFDLGDIPQTEKRIGLMDYRARPGSRANDAGPGAQGTLGSDLLGLNGALIDLEGKTLWLFPVAATK